MSASFSASVVVGVRLSELCEVRTVKEPVRRFDETTGSPYEKDVERQAVYVFGVLVPGLGPDPTGWDRTLGLHIICHDDDEADLGKWLAGTTIVNARDDNSPVAFVCQAVIDAHDRVWRTLEALAGRLGVPADVAARAIKVRPFLLASVSY